MRIYLQSNIEGENPRFCQMILEKDMLGGWSLIVESGVQGLAGRVKRSHFENRNDAEQALEQQRNKQIAKGYRIVYIQGHSSNE